MTPTLDTLRAELRRTAQAATKGEWKLVRYPFLLDIAAGSVAICSCDMTENAAHIYAAQPANILALLDHIDALERDARRYRWLRDPEVDPGTVLDKRVPWQSKDGETESIDWEYRSGDELDAAIDKAMAALAEQGEPK